MNGKQVRLYAAILHSNKMLLVCPDPLRLCKLAAVRLGGVNDICQGHELGCN